MLPSALGKKMGVQIGQVKRERKRREVEEDEWVPPNIETKNSIIYYVPY